MIHKIFVQPTANAQGAIVASMPAGSLIGALSVTYLGDKLGRKKTIILAGLFWVIGSILQCASVVSVSSCHTVVSLLRYCSRTVACSSLVVSLLVTQSASLLPLSLSINPRLLHLQSAVAWFPSNNGLSLGVSCFSTSFSSVVRT